MAATTHETRIPTKLISIIMFSFPFWMGNPTVAGEIRSDRAFNFHVHGNLHELPSHLHRLPSVRIDGHPGEQHHLGRALSGHVLHPAGQRLGVQFRGFIGRSTWPLAEISASKGHQ